MSKRPNPVPSAARSGEISASEAAKRLELTKQAVGIWTARPGAPVRREGVAVFVQWPAFMRWRESELVRQAKAEVSGGDLDTARTRKANAEAELAELEVSKARGSVVDVTDFGTAVGRILDICSARVRSFSVRLSHFGPEVETAAEVEAERIIGELHAWDEDVLDEVEPEPEEEAA